MHESYTDIFGRSLVGVRGDAMLDGRGCFRQGAPVESQAPVVRYNGATVREWMPAPNDDVGRFGNACELRVAQDRQSMLAFAMPSGASQAGFGPLSAAQDAETRRTLDRFRGRMEVLAGVWDLPLATLANAIRAAKKGDYGLLAAFIAPRLFVGAGALPRLAAYRAGVAAQDLLARGATQTTVERVFPRPSSGQLATVTFRKYQLVQGGQEKVVYHVYIDDVYCLQWRATQGIPPNEFEEALWKYLAEFILR